ncbi:MAG TPA: hypothetical protein VLM89_01310 [Phycisphaerae bacterium]|nr:hypothetical protein [Phycisphaerae bacterium]
MSTQPTPIILGSRYTPAADESTTSDLRLMIAKVMAILCQRLWLFVIPLLGGMLVSLAASLTLPRRYVLSTIFERRDDVVITKLISSNSPYSFATLRRSLWINLMGYHALGAAIDDLGLTKDLPRDEKGELTSEGRVEKQKIINRLSGCLELNTLEKSEFLDLIEVRYKGDDPDLGVQLVAKLSENYMRNTREWITQVLIKSKDFFAAEADKRRESATRKEAELLHMTVTHPGITPADPDVIHQRLIAVKMAVEETQLRRDEMWSKARSLTEYLESLSQPDAAGTVLQRSGPAGTVPNPQRARLQQEMDRVKAEISDAKALRQMTDNHPLVVGLREKLEQIRQMYEQQPEIVAGPAFEPPPTDASAAVVQERRRVEAELKALKESLTRIDADLARRQAEKAQLEQDKGMLFERRQAYLMRQEEVQGLKGDLRVWDGHVDTVSRVLAAEEGKRGICFGTVEVARRPARPTSPTLGGVFLLSAGIGLALATAAVFLREVLDRTLRDPAAIRQTLGIPVLETIGDIRVGKRRTWFSRHTLLPAIAGVEAIALAGVSVMVFLSLQRPELYHRLAIGRTTATWLTELCGT